MSNDIIIILTLIIMEGVLSIDNAAVLATMVKHLPEAQRTKALQYWIFWAYAFRWLALLFASIIIQFWIFKLAGGLYLLYLAYTHFTKPSHEDTITTQVAKGFWSTVVAVELMDMVFSIDNVLAAVAMSPKLWVVLTGVAIGILAMRFVAGGFIKLMEKYPALETSAYIVIGILGAKLSLHVVFELLGFHHMAEMVSSHVASMVTSWATFAIFGYPILKTYFKK